MIILLKNIQGGVLTNIVGDVNYSSTIQAEIQREDFVKIYGLTAFLQNLSQTPKTFRLQKPLEYGYKPPINIIQKNLEINF